MVTKRRNYTKRRKPKTNRRNTKRHTKRRHTKRRHTKRRNHSKKSNKILIQEGGMFCCAGRRKRKAGVSPTSNVPVKSTSTTEPELESYWGNLGVPEGYERIKPAGRFGPALSEITATKKAREEWNQMLKQEEDKLSAQKAKENVETLQQATLAASAGKKLLDKARQEIARNAINEQREYNIKKGRTGRKTNI